MHLLDYLIAEVYRGEDDKPIEVPPDVVAFCKAAAKVIAHNPPTNLAYEAQGFSLVLADHSKVGFFDGAEEVAPKRPDPVNLFNVPDSPKGPGRNPPSINLFG